MACSLNQSCARMTGRFVFTQPGPIAVRRGGANRVLAFSCELVGMEGRGTVQQEHGGTRLMQETAFPVLGDVRRETENSQFPVIEAHFPAMIIA